MSFSEPGLSIRLSWPGISNCVTSHKNPESSDESQTEVPSFGWTNEKQKLKTSTLLKRCVHWCSWVWCSLGWSGVMGAFFPSLLRLLFYSGVGNRPQHLIQWPTGPDPAHLIPDQRPPGLQFGHPWSALLCSQEREENKPCEPPGNAGKHLILLDSPQCWQLSTTTCWALAVPGSVGPERRISGKSLYLPKWASGIWMCWSQKGETIQKGEALCGRAKGLARGEGLGVLHSLLNLIPWASTPTPMASITSSFLQNPYFSSPNLFFQLQTPRSNIQQNDSESSGSNYPKLHSSSLLTYTCSWWVRPDSDQIPHISIPSQQLAPIAATC